MLQWTNECVKLYPLEINFKHSIFKKRETNLMNCNFCFRKVNFEQKLELRQREVGGTIRVFDENRFADFSVLKTPKLAVRLLPDGVKLLHLNKYFKTFVEKEIPLCSETRKNRRTRKGSNDTHSKPKKVLIFVLKQFKTCPVVNDLIVF